MGWIFGTNKASMVSASRRAARTVHRYAGGL